MLRVWGLGLGFGAEGLRFKVLGLIDVYRGPIGSKDPNDRVLGPRY